MNPVLRSFKAMANDTRLKVIEILLEYRQLPLGDIATRINRPYKTVAGHLKILEKAGLLRTQFLKGEALYSLNKSKRLFYNLKMFEIVRQSKK